jgi:hypothetical protein
MKVPGADETPPEGPLSEMSIKQTECYDCPVFNFGRPKTAGQWMAHVVLGIVALFLVWWMLRLYVL